MTTVKSLLCVSFLLGFGGFFFAASDQAQAHEGGAELDSLGCHYARNYRNYHCHEGFLEGEEFLSRGELMRRYHRLKKAHEEKEEDDGLL